MPKIKKTNQQWKAILTPKQYTVCREKSTEPAFTGIYEHCKDAGIYHCICCENPLFASTAKYPSGSGWASFYAPIATDSLEKHIDCSHGMQRTEVTCKACASHLGHVFTDGPLPTGLRFCINSVALRLQKSM